MKRIILKLIACLLLFELSTAYGQVVNGSMNGTAGQGVAPTSWTVWGPTPDLSCATCSMYAMPSGSCTTWLSPGPSASTNGGNFANMGYGESIYQDITGLTPNATYKLSHLYTCMGFNCSGPGLVNSLVPPYIEMSNQMGFSNSPATPSSLYTWRQYDHYVKFNSSTTRLLIGGLTGGPSFYNAYDDVSLTTTCQQNLPGFITIGSNTSIANASAFIAAYGNNVFNGKYIINGNFTINTNLTLSNCDIVCGSGSTITVNSGIALNIDRSFMHSCTNLWNGIKANSFATLNLNNNIIEDAHTAIEYLGYSNTKINFNTFTNNVIGIYYRFNEVFSKINTQNELIGNTFSGIVSQPLKPKYTGFVSNTMYSIQPSQPTTITKPFAGIMVLDVEAFDIDNPIGLSSNTFSNMTNGIIAFNVYTSTINYCNFRNITSLTGYTNRANGHGIYYRNGINYGNYNPLYNLTVTGRGKTASGFDFEGCTYGIYGEGSDGQSCSIRNNRMDAMTRGVDLLNIYNPSVDNNSIKASLYGIHCNFTTYWPSMRITNNDVLMNGSTSATTGILIDDVFKYGHHIWNDINNNCITMSGTTGFGIEVNNVSHLAQFNINCNSIALNNPSTNLGGIKSTNCYMSFIQDNFIFSNNRTSANTNGLNPVAIHINGTSGSRVPYNRFNDIYIGLRFTGPCLSTIWGTTSGTGANASQNLVYGNRLQNLSTGFRFDQVLNHNDIKYNFYTMTGTTPTLTTVYNMGNEFNGTITTRAFSPNTTTHPKIYWSGLPKYNPCLSGSCSPTSIGNTVTNSIYAPSTIPTCGTGICGNTPIYPRLPKDLVAYAVVTDNPFRTSVLTKTLDYAVYSQEMIWQAEFSLYCELKPIESTFADTTIEKQFIDEKDQQGFYEQYMLQVDANQWLNQEDSSQYYLSKTLTDIQNTIDSLSFIRDTIADSLKAGIQNIIGANQASILTIMNQLDTFMDSVKLARIKHSEELTLRNDSLMTIGVSDSLLQLFNSIHFAKFAIGDLDLSELQKATLFYVASQCPFVNYDAVYRARSAYRLFDDTLYYNDSLICDEAGIINKMASSHIKSDPLALTIHLYPNPSQDRASIQFSEIPSNKLTIFITDILGRVFHNNSQILFSNVYELNTSKWTEGNYFVQVYEGKKLLSSKKFIVIH